MGFAGGPILYEQEPIYRWEVVFAVAPNYNSFGSFNVCLTRDETRLTDGNVEIRPNQIQRRMRACFVRNGVIRGRKRRVRQLFLEKDRQINLIIIAKIQFIMLDELVGDIEGEVDYLNQEEIKRFF